MDLRGYLGTMDEKPKLALARAVPSHRLSRLGRLSALTAGVAGNMALGGLAQIGQGKRPVARDLLLTSRNISKITDQLATMRGAAMKIGQLVSMDTGDVLPPELAQILARLRDNAHFMPPAQLKKVLQANWGAGWLAQFSSFDVKPIAAASIGQVHRARLKDGRDLAIKVQYPGVAKSIDSDVANVGALIKMSGLLPKKLDIAPYLAEAQKQLQEETDYLREAEFMRSFTHALHGDIRFAVPEPHSDWTTKSILAMSFVVGIPIEKVANLSQATRDSVAERLIDLTLQELFCFGQMQTDPNFANYLYDQGADQIILLDFGAAQKISPMTVSKYRSLLKAGLQKDAEAIEQSLQHLGFIDSDTATDHRRHVVDMAKLVFDMLGQDRKTDFGTPDFSQQIQAEGLKLAESGFVPPPIPMEVLLVQRKVGGVFLLAKRLGAKIDAKSIILKSITSVLTR